MIFSPIELSLENLGLGDLELVCWNLPRPSLHEEAIRRPEGRLSHEGPLVVRTGYFRGKVPQFCPGIPAEMPNPAATWPEPAIREARTGESAARFHQHFEKFQDTIAPAVRDAGPGPVQE